MRRTLVVISIVLIGVAAWLTWESPSGERAPRRGTGTDGPRDPNDVPDVAPNPSPELRLPEDGRPVEGVVVDGSGHLVEGIDVWVRPVEGHWFDHRHLLRRVTAADGRFRIDRVPPGAVRIHTDARFWEPVTVETESGDTDVRIVLHDAAGEIRGTLVPPEGWKLPEDPDIQIFYRCTRGPEESDTLANIPEEDRMVGLSFRLPSLPPGRYRVRARIDGFGCGVTKDIDVRARESTKTEIVLAEGHVLTGLVVDPDGEPIAGAKVAAVDQEWGTALQIMEDRAAMWSPGATARTDASGRYRIVGLEAGTYSVGGRAPGHRFTEMVDVSLPRDGDAPDLVLGPGATLVVICPGADPEAITLYASLENGVLYGEFDDEGVGRIESVPPGERHVSLHGPNWTRRLEMDLPAGRVTRITIRPPVGKATLTGRILRAGEPQPGRRLVLLYAEEDLTFGGRADSEGRFRFESLPAGTPAIQVGRGDMGPSLRATRHLVKIVEGENRLDVELPAGRIRLRILDEQTGEPVPAWVDFEGRPVGKNWDIGKVLLIEDLEPRIHVLVVHSPGHGPRRITASAALDSPILDVRLSPASPLTLEIRDEDGRPVGEPAIGIVDESGWDLSDDAWDWGFVDEKTGRYRFLLARGKYRVRVTAEGRGGWERDVVTPHPGGRIEIVLRKE